MRVHSEAKIRGRLRFTELTQYDADRIEDGMKPYKDFVPNGRIIFHEDNVITDGGDQRIAELVGGLSTQPVVDMAIGDGGVSLGDPTVPIAPTKADTVLGNQIRRKPISSVGLITTPDFQIQFNETFFTNDPSNDPFLGTPVINEAGLFTADNVLFARKTYIPIPFDTGDRVGVLATWNIHVL